MSRRLTDWLWKAAEEVMVRLIVVVLLIGVIAGVLYCYTLSTAYEFDGVTLTVPYDGVSVDNRAKGLGVVVGSGVNVTIHNTSDQFRVLKVEFRLPNNMLEGEPDYMDLPPGKLVKFGAPLRYMGMHVDVLEKGSPKPPPLQRNVRPPAVQPDLL